jgi:hypothetical protein
MIKTQKTRVENVTQWQNIEFRPNTETKKKNPQETKNKGNFPQLHKEHLSKHIAIILNSEKLSMCPQKLRIGQKKS